MKLYTESTLTARGLSVFADDSNQHLATVSIDCEASHADARRIAATWNACHGLDLPADVPPGILAEVIRAAFGLLAVIEEPGLDSLDNRTGRLATLLDQIGHPDVEQVIQELSTPVSP